jgi:hypothetical protein
MAQTPGEMGNVAASVLRSFEQAALAALSRIIGSSVLDRTMERQVGMASVQDGAAA